MALKDICQAIHAELVANGSVQANALLEYGFAPKAGDGLPPRVYWEPSVDRFGGPDPRMTRAEQAANPDFPRQIRTRIATVLVHIWGGNGALQATHATIDDFVATETLLNAVVSATHHQTRGSYELLAGGWVKGGTDAGTLGHRYVLSIAFEIPLTEIQTTAPAKPTRTVITAETQTTEMQFPATGHVVSGSPGV
jgi:hypothetical protein